MKVIASVFSLSFFLLLSSSFVSAESEINVAFVDLKKAIWESNAGKTAQSNLKKQYDSAQNKIDSQTKELERLKKNLNAQRESLKFSALVEKEEELLKKEKGLKRNYVDSKEALRRKEGLLSAELRQGLRKVIADIGKEKSFTIILEKGGNSVLYADNGIDITSEVINRFNKLN